MGARDIAKKIIPSKTFQTIEPYGHMFESIMAQSMANFPAKNLKVIGVTGTDGKTTTSTLIAQMIRNSGKKVGMMTTTSVDYGDGKGLQANNSRLTTMGVKDLVAKLKKIQANNVDWLVLETTSHALAQHRTWGVPYSVAVMTNLSHEHLDYHKTFERYRNAKVQMFKLANANKNGLQIGIVNADDPNCEFFAKAIKNSVSYGIKSGDLRATNLKLSPNGSEYIAKINNQEYKIVCNLPGSFNVSNSLAAVAVGRAIGLSPKQIQSGIASLHEVEGRMTRVSKGQNFDLIVDYAHTPDSFKKIFKELKPLAKKRMIAVFGSAGRRDEAKRSEQGRIAGKYCDIVIATEEDDRDIDGQLILEQICEGALKAGKKLDKNLFLIHKREAAIQKAVDLAEPGDMVILLGKGHEKSILTNGPKAAELRHLPQSDSDQRRVIKRSFDEVKSAEQAIKNKLKK